mmetsp:Transcript_39176/g.122556  ORF Transcript_39176/g.122556 Transcript_39176/m.122556 type:complete len:1287 (-) Transcript_39176:462-4322(-)
MASIAAALVAALALAGQAQTGLAQSVDLCDSWPVTRLAAGTNLAVLARAQNRMDCQLFVPAGASITIQAGATIEAPETSLNSSVPPALIIEQGGYIDARGTAENPITFTTSHGVTEGDEISFAGSWGGVIICGRAPILGGGTLTGVDGVPYGGDDPQDNSGILQYVRVWYPGAMASGNHELNGITFAGVGAGTTVDHIEVAFSLDDGVEYYGGNVNVKYLSVLFPGDDGVDVSAGFYGKIQYLYVLMDKKSNHAMEIDGSFEFGTVNQTFPQIFNALLVAHVEHEPAAASSDDQFPSIILLRGGAGGRLGNIIVENVNEVGVLRANCTDEVYSRSDFTATSRNTLFFSSSNIIHTVGGVQMCDECVNKATIIALNTDPQLVMQGPTPSHLTPFIDPRPIDGGNSFTEADFSAMIDLDGSEDTFFDDVNFKGAFPLQGSGNWLVGLSWLDDNARTPINVDGTVVDCAGLTESETWTASEPMFLTCQVVVHAPAVLTIEEGATVYVYRDDGNGTAPALIIERGASIWAPGTAENAITFQSAVSASHLPAQGLWGGVIVLGKAHIVGPESVYPSYGQGEAEVLGVQAGYPYGGENDKDSSGWLSYFRVWHAGALGSELNGLTLAGVGSRTTVDHIEVAFSSDDCLQILGGTVSVKYVSVFGCLDDGIDLEQGYRGRIQFAYAILYHGSDAALEVSGAGPDADFPLDTSPSVYNAKFVGYATSEGNEEGTPTQTIVKLGAGTGGSYGNIIMTNVAEVGLLRKDCGAEAHVLDAGDLSGAADVFWSPNNIIYTVDNGTQFLEEGSACQAKTNFTSLDIDPEAIMPIGRDVLNSDFVDPRSIAGGNSYQDVDVIPHHKLTKKDYKGAFSSSDNWLIGLSLLDDLALTPAAAGVLKCGDITSSETWSNSQPVVLTCNVIVKSGCTLTIQEGAIIQVYRDDGSGDVAPSLVIEQGARILARGTARHPITFTTALSEAHVPSRGLWGGLVVLGRAPVNGPEPRIVDALSALEGTGTYGGTDEEDDSGELSYVRVWYSGAIAGSDERVSGVTLAGVGRGTTVDHLEVAYSGANGVDFFGGTVDVKHLSVLFCKDTAIAVGQGYMGRMQYVFSMVGADGRRAFEASGDADAADKAPSFPQVQNALFIGYVEQDAPTLDIDLSLMQLYNGTGGDFGNIILVNTPTMGVELMDCNESAMDLTAVRPSNASAGEYLFLSPNIVVYNAQQGVRVSEDCASVLSVRSDDPLLRAVPGDASTETTFIDPTTSKYTDDAATTLAPAYKFVDAVPDDGWFECLFL